MKTYIVYVDGNEAGYIKAGSHNAAEKKAKKKYPNANDVSVLNYGYETPHYYFGKKE